jgi:hypothetical protein
MSAVPSREDSRFGCRRVRCRRHGKPPRPNLKRLNRHWRVLQRDVPDAGSLLGCYDWVELSRGHMSCARKDAVAKRGEWGTNAWQLVRADLTIPMIDPKALSADLAIEAATGML